MNRDEQRLIAAALGVGVLVGVVFGIVAPQMVGGGAVPVDPNLAGRCERDVHLRSTELLDLKERVQATRVAWNRLELELGPIGGVPSWWPSQAALEVGQAAAHARAAELGAEIIAVDCEENPCILIIRPWRGNAPVADGSTAVLNTASLTAFPVHGATRLSENAEHRMQERLRRLALAPPTGGAP
jgi:hypothetical protein